MQAGERALDAVFDRRDLWPDEGGWGVRRQGEEIEQLAARLPVELLPPGAGEAFDRGLALRVGGEGGEARGG